MDKPRLSDWASIAEITAAVAVILSLVYVGIELRHNTQALQHESYQNVLDRMSEEQSILATNEDLLEIAMKAEVAPDELSAFEWRRFKHLVLPSFGTWEYIYLANQDGAVSELQWRAFQPYFLELICSPGYFKIWDEMQYAFAAEFIDYMSTSAIPHCTVE